MPVVEEQPVDGDADNDGVSDSADRCPATPRGVEVDSQGCALDSDNDGVPNHRDNCLIQKLAPALMRAVAM